MSDNYYIAALSQHTLLCWVNVGIVNDRHYNHEYLRLSVRILVCWPFAKAALWRAGVGCRIIANLISFSKLRITVIINPTDVAMCGNDVACIDCARLSGSGKIIPSPDALRLYIVYGMSQNRDTSRRRFSRGKNWGLGLGSVFWVNANFS